MAFLTEVHTTPMHLDQLEGIASRRQLAALFKLADELKSRLAGRVIWNVSSTAAGGGVAEMLHRLIGHARGIGFDARWLVVSGDPDFFRITKRLHNALHGELGDGTPLDARAAAVYEQALRGNSLELRDHVRSGDMVYLHDPQTAGLAPGLADCGVAIVWRCHIGNGDATNSEETAAWAFLKPYLENVTRCVFSRSQYIPRDLRSKSVVVPPNIDPLSPKNQPMKASTARSILRHIGVLGGPAGRGRRTFLRTDGTPSRVDREASIVRLGPPPGRETPLVVQVSRWDRLKDPIGVLRGFERFVTHPAADGAHLMLVGPHSEGVTDDPEGTEVYLECVRAWERLDEAVRRRVHLVSLPMDDMEENAAMVNAIQRHAAVIVQKSIREGFGLTVTEAMWKARPVIGSAVGGIQDQIQHQSTGLLVDPNSIEDFVGALAWVFEDADRARTMGRKAKVRVKHEYLGARSLLRWGAVLGDLLVLPATSSQGKPCAGEHG